MPRFDTQQAGHRAADNPRAPVSPWETKWPVLGSTPELLLWGAVP